jgi:hypothetical protein
MENFVTSQGLYFLKLTNSPFKLSFTHGSDKYTIFIKANDINVFKKTQKD